MTPVETAWLAGLLDGEGTFDSPRGNPRVRVKMTDFDIVLRAADLMGAKTHRERTPYLLDRKPLLVAQITGAPAIAVMRAVLPHMSSRRSARITSIVMDFEDRSRPASPIHLPAPQLFPTSNPPRLFPLAG